MTHYLSPITDERPYGAPIPLGAVCETCGHELDWFWGEDGDAYGMWNPVPMSWCPTCEGADDPDEDSRERQRADSLAKED